MARAEIAIDDLKAHVKPTDEKPIRRRIIQRIEKRGA
jgi:hypothetical protein